MNCPRYKMKDITTVNTISRRKFISTFSAATAAIIVGRPGFSLFAKSKSFQSKVSTANIRTYERAAIRNAVESMITDLGGLSDIVSSGDSVAIKINMTGGSYNARNFHELSGLPVGETYWTHPEILRATGELLVDAGASNIYVLEAISDDDSYYHSEFGYKTVVDGFGGSFIDLNKKEPYADFIQKSVGDKSIVYHTLTQNGIFDNIDCFISLAKSKSHMGAGITHSMKNLVGTLPMAPGLYNNGETWRAVIHGINPDNSNDQDKNDSISDENTYSNLRRVILDLNNTNPIQLVINDAIKTVSGGEGPWVSGEFIPVSFNKLIASKDPVAADSIATQVIGYDPMDAGTWEYYQGINYLQKASDLQMGTYDLSEIEVVDSTPTSLREGRGLLPDNLEIHNYPNPFNMETTFRINLPESGFVSVIIYNSQGQKVRTLVSKSLLAGVNKMRWNGKNNFGKDVSSGMYFANLTYKGHQKTHKLAIVK